MRIVYYQVRLVIKLSKDLVMDPGPIEPTATLCSNTRVDNLVANGLKGL
jgi:hypothetical protein